MSAPRTGVVFGGSSGIGSAVVRAMRARGHRVLSASRRGTSPNGGDSVVCDIRDGDGVAEALCRASPDGARVDWVVNAAGVGYYAPFEERFGEQWQQILDTNVIGLLNLVSALRGLPVPVRNLVQIGSLAGSRPSRTPGNDVYAAAKTAGAQLLSRHREQLRASGVGTKVTVITPGYVGETDFSRNFYGHAPDLAEPLLDRFVPLSPTDVASVVEHVLLAPGQVEISEIVLRPPGQPD
ncbi:SDR family oxidoreductase [Streptomyces sp. NPDC094447]|uniref:SDR family oxidoreductase n=1 Tax=Streptomyces sp. NPDC094447 TaxID=3366062 RepID=UPI0037F98C20